MRVFSKVTGAVASLMLLSVGVWAAGRYELARSLLSTNFLAHQYCFLSQSSLIWTNAASDFLIWLSYLTIAAGLLALLWKTSEYLPFHWVFVAFGTFIVACGFTHFFEMVTLWNPLYWLSTSVKTLTALASVVTAVAFVPLVPRAAAAIRFFNAAYANSEQQRVETLSKLLDTQERMRLAVESAGIATWEWNLTSRELIWDDRCRAVFGIPDCRSLRYEDFLYRVHPEDRPQTQAMLEEAVAEGGEYNARFRVVRDDGEVRAVISRGKALCNDEGHPVRFLGTVIDITRELQAEDALLKAEKLAVAGRMAASIAHEINNPLEAATGLLYVARTEAGVPEHVREQLKLVEQELLRAGQITHSTLTFYRESPNPIPTNIVELVDGILTFQQGSIRKTGMEVRKEFVYSGPILAFPGELRQIFTNLISNAIDATQADGKLSIRVRPGRDLLSNRYGYRIVIADNGPGIPNEALKKVFDPFYTTKGEKGTGLGLWITHQLVRKHGGSIKLRSRHSANEGPTGTVFSIWLPLRPEFTNGMNSGDPRLTQQARV